MMKGATRKSAGPDLRGRLSITPSGSSPAERSARMRVMPGFEPLCAFSIITTAASPSRRWRWRCLRAT